MKKLLALFFVISLLQVEVCLAQSRDSRESGKRLFEEDKSKTKRLQEKREQQLRKSTAPTTNDLDLRAPQVEYDKDTSEAVASGGVVISKGGAVMQADKARVNSAANTAKLDGNVAITHAGGDIFADSANVNLDSETGTFNNAKFSPAENAFRVEAEKAEKLTDVEYQLEESLFTSCDCADGSKPWSINCNNSHITQESYAHTYGTTFRMYDVPLFYTPYFVFPVKTERSSGLLVPDFGYSSVDGARYKQQLFTVLDDSTDLSFIPFVETKTRYGTGIEFRKSFSRKNNLKTRWYFSDESQRDGDLRGIVKTDTNNPSFDEDRFGGFLEHVWTGDSTSDFPVSFVSDIHYVSDDLFLRELPDDDIAAYNSRFTTSFVGLRAGVGDYITTELAAEYNQLINDAESVSSPSEHDDRLTLQRLPELTVQGSRSFRPFGFNPYGIKLVTKGAFSYTNFSREEGVDGSRLNFSPGFSVPFHYKNYFNSSVGLTGVGTKYSLNDVAGDADDSPTRETFIGQYQISTGFERIFDLPEDSFIKDITAGGIEEGSPKLSRLKHTIEPFVKYSYVPNVDQDENPLFDSYDRIRYRSVVTYGINSSLIGKFLGDSALGGSIPDLRPIPDRFSLEELAREANPFDQNRALSLEEPRILQTTRGARREIVGFSIKQAYDYVEAQNDNSPLRDAYSDIAATIDFIPKSNFALALESTWNTDRSEVSSAGVGLGARSSRGDVAKLRYTLVDPQVLNSAGEAVDGSNTSQVEGNLETLITDKLKFGYYARFDQEDGEFLEQSGALRWYGGCNCWHIDFGYRDRLNPDKQEYTVRLTFAGLGGLNQNLRSRVADGQ